MSAGKQKGQHGKCGKSEGRQSLAFGETAQLPGGVPTSRKFTRIYVPGKAETEGAPLPRGSLYDR